MHRHSRRSQRGFTLIELGIVIGVIAVLATIVLVGRGFLESSRVSKIVETVNAIAKGAKVYAGHAAGRFPNAADATLLNTLQARELLSFSDGAIDVVPGFTFVNAAHDADGVSFAVSINCTNNAISCDDIFNAKRDDESLIMTGTINGLTCTTAAGPGGSGNVVLCFSI